MAEYKISEITKQKIFLAASVLFEEKGYENTTVLDICNYSGSSGSRLNYHYGSKEQLAVIVAQSLPKQTKEEINRRAPWIAKDFDLQNIAFDILWCKILFSKGKIMDCYRNLYTKNFVIQHIVNSFCRDYLHRHDMVKNEGTTKTEAFIYAHAFTHAICSIADPVIIDTIQKNPDVAIKAISELYLYTMKVPEDRQKSLINDAHQIIDSIDFEVSGITNISFFDKQ